MCVRGVCVCEGLCMCVYVKVCVCVCEGVRVCVVCKVRKPIMPEQ